jgi:serine O-acetyltransferase
VSQPRTLDREFAARLLAQHRQSTALPLKRDVERLLDELLSLLFPQLSEVGRPTLEGIESRLTAMRRDLQQRLGVLLPAERSQAVAESLAGMLPEIHDMLRMDAEAILQGDPAAESLDEVVAAYPGFMAITAHRIAHGLHVLGVPVLPRLLSEVAHTRTGVDIHPGATIGRSFCIDHGTGVVIGETAVLGDRVKVYQGVTLGALSVSKSAAGTKRHPTIEDRVVLYSSATVLGGDTVVGHDTIVGGNVWLTHSVPPHSFVYNTSQVRVRRAADLMEASDYSI